MKFRPCIDILNGKVRQIVGSSLGKNTEENFVSTKGASYYAKLYRKDNIGGGHVIMLDNSIETKKQALKAIKTFPGGFQIGGGINDLNAEYYIDNGAEKVILSSYIFDNGKLKIEILKDLKKKVCKERLVLDLSCRKRGDDYFIVIDRWQTFTDLKISIDTFRKIEEYCSELLIHCVDKEGKKEGIDLELLKILSTSKTPVTYAGGISSFEDLEAIKDIGKGKIDFTVGSNLDIFGCELKYKDVCNFSMSLRIPRSRDEAISANHQKDCFVPHSCGTRNDNNNLAVRIIPCLDVKDGRVVKGVNFVDFKDAGDPVELGKFYSEEGADELIFLDITATYEGRNTFLDIVNNISHEINIPFTVGGGIRNFLDIENMLRSGADKVSIGSEAIKRPNLITEAVDRFGSQCIVVSVDAKYNYEKKDYEVFIKGGRENTGISALEFSKDMERRGAGELLLNSLDRDGTGEGFDISLLKSITSEVKIPVIASSGAGERKHFLEAINEGKVSGVLAATLFHYGKVRISELKNYLKREGVEIRI